MEREAHNYTLEYKNWKFAISEWDTWTWFYINIYYKDNWCSMRVSPRAKTVEEAKERVENFIKTELK